tara:strand:- start:117 stop:515 length:399 start_codon:yes stop_codon:yes gene_type:complete
MLLFIKITGFYFLIFTIGISSYSAQHELVGAKRSHVAQNYKLTANSNQRFQGFSQKQITNLQINNQKEQEDIEKELRKSHLLKQSKATQKRMKANLKKAHKRNKRKPLSPNWIIAIKRKKVLSQRKLNKYDE